MPVLAMAGAVVARADRVPGVVVPIAARALEEDALAASANLARADIRRRPGVGSLAMHLRLRVMGDSVPSVETYARGRDVLMACPVHAVDVGILPIKRSAA